jgi:hypothetical protein
MVSTPRDAVKYSTWVGFIHYNLKAVHGRNAPAYFAAPLVSKKKLFRNALMKHPTMLHSMGRLLALLANIKLSSKKLARVKHSGLFCCTIRI